MSTLANVLVDHYVTAAMWLNSRYVPQSEQFVR